MGKFGFTKHTTGNLSIPGQENRSFLEAAGTAVFDALDWPANITRSAVAYAQTGDTDYLENIEAAFNPMVTSRRVQAEEITGSDSFIANLATDILLDPTLPISSILQPTKAAKALTGVKSLQTELKLASKLAKYTKAAEDAEAVAKLTERLSQLKGVAKTAHQKGRIPRTAAVTLGVPFTTKFDVDIPLPRQLETLARNVQLLPDARIPDLTKKLQRLKKEERKSAAAVRDAVKPDDVAAKMEKHDKVVRAIDRTTNRLEGLSDGLLGSVISPETANKLRAFGHKVSGAFKHTAEKRETETLRLLTQMNIARDLEDLHTTDRALLAGRVDSLKELGQKYIDETGKPLGRPFTPHEVSIRLLRGSEADFIVNHKIPNVDALLQDDVAKATEELVKKHGDPKLLKDEAKAKFETELQSKVFAAKKRAEARRLRLADAHKIVGDLMPEELDVIKTIRDQMDQLVPLEQSLSLGTEELATSKGFLSYFPRILSTEFKNMKGIDRKKYGIITRDFQTRLAAAGRRTMYPETELVEINKLYRDEYGLPFDVFETDVVKAVVRRKQDHITNIHRAAAINVATDLFNQTRKTFGARKIADVWKKLGLDVQRAPKGYLPGHLVRDLTNVHQLFIKPMDPEGIIARSMDVIDKVNGVWRTALTIPFPGYHHRNLLNNMVMSAMTGNVKPRDYIDAFKLMRKKAKGALTPEDQKLWSRLVSYGLESTQTDEYMNLLKNSLGDEILERPVRGSIDVIMRRLGKQTVGRTPQEVDLVPMGRAYGRFVEQLSRAAHMLGEMRAGKSPVQVVESINKYLFDTNRLTSFEKQYVKPMFMFYSWLRNNIPLMLKTLLVEPRYANWYGKITGLGDDEAPPYLKGSFAFKAPEGFFGPNQFVGSLGLGLEDLFLLSVSKANPSANPVASGDQVNQLARNVLRQLGPALKVPLEIAGGKNFFTGREIGDEGVLEYAKNVLPISRGVSEISKLFDKERSIAARAIDLMTGARLYTVDPKKVKIANVKRAGLRTGRVKEFPILIPTEKGDKDAKKILKEVRRAIKESK